MLAVNGDSVGNVFKSTRVNGQTSDAYTKAVHALCLVCNVLHKLGIEHTTKQLTNAEVRKGAKTYSIWDLVP